MLALSIALSIKAFTYPAESAQFPRFLTVLQVLFSAGLLVRSIVGRRGEPPRDEPGRRPSLIAPLAVFSSLGLYIVCIQYLGYFVSTALFLAISMIYLGRHRPLVVFGATAAFILVVYSLFVLFIGVRLPRGMLF